MAKSKKKFIAELKEKAKSQGGQLRYRDLMDQIEAEEIDLEEAEAIFDELEDSGIK